ncbi:hypothetical protein Bca4012_063975 [Brassica carinata]
MAERFSVLSERERNKKSTNLSGFLNKKMMDDKKESLKKKRQQTDSLRKCLSLKILCGVCSTFQESLLLDQQQQPKETTSVVSTDLSSNHPSTTTTTTSLMSIMKVGTFGIICCYLLYLSLTNTLVARFDLKRFWGSGERYCWLRQNVSGGGQGLCVLRSLAF